MNSRYILPAVLAVLFTFTYVSDPVDTPEPEVKHAIKLTTRHLPIHKYFADEDDDDSLTIARQYMIARRESGVIKTRTNIGPTEDDIQITQQTLDYWLETQELFEQNNLNFIPALGVRIATLPSRFNPCPFHGCCLACSSCK